MSYYENDWQKIRKTAWDGLKLASFSFVLWVYCLYLITSSVLSRIYHKLTDG